MRPGGPIAQKAKRAIERDTQNDRGPECSVDIPRSSVGEAVNRLRGLIAFLSDTISHTQDKLAPILKDELEADPAAVPQVQPECPIASDLQQMAEQLESEWSRLRALCSRIDL